MNKSSCSNQCSFQIKDVLLPSVRSVVENYKNHNLSHLGQCIKRLNTYWLLPVVVCLCRVARQSDLW